MDQILPADWNNPEPEVAIICDGRGEARGATLANDVNLRDIGGRGALLLGKAKGNSASCAFGPLIRRFDGNFNRVVHCEDAPPWTFGIGALMRNLASRGLLS